MIEGEEAELNITLRKIGNGEVFENIPKIIVEIQS